MTSDVYTPAAIQSYIFAYNIRAALIAIFGFFCIFAILRYSGRSMEKNYRFHLLNMTISILVGDLFMTVLCRPYPILPVSGGCFIGELNGILMGRVQPGMSGVYQLVSSVMFWAVRRNFLDIYVTGVRTKKLAESLNFSSVKFKFCVWKFCRFCLVFRS